MCIHESHSRANKETSYICMYLCMYACMYLCMYVCAYVLEVLYMAFIIHECMFVCICVHAPNSTTIGIRLKTATSSVQQKECSQREAGDLSSWGPLRPSTVISSLADSSLYSDMN